MEFVKVALTELKPFQNNVRKHPEAQIKEMIRSLDAYGQTRAFVIDEDNTVLVGNCMLEAMKRMGKTEADAYRVIGYTDKEKKKLLLSDNKIYRLGIDDYDEIDKMLSEFANESDFDIAGYDESIIRELQEKLDDELDDEITGQVGTERNDEEEIPTGTQEMLEKVKRGEDISEEEGDYEAPEAKETGETVTSKGWEGQGDKKKQIICPNCGEVIYVDV